MPFDAHKDLAVSTVATAPSPPTTGTSLVVASGHGSRFPASPFDVTIWPGTASPDPINAEVARVVNVVSDTLTIQRGTPPRSVVTGDFIAATITSKVLQDIEAISLRTFTWGVAQGIFASTGTNVANELVAPASGTIYKAWARCKVPPTGASLIFDIQRNGTSIWVNANRLSIPANGTASVTTLFDRPSLVEGDVFTLDVKQVGSTQAGRDIILQVAYR